MPGCRAAQPTEEVGHDALGGGDGAICVQGAVELALVLGAFLFVAVPIVEDGEGVAAELLAGRREGDFVVLAFEELLAELCFEALH